MLSILLIVAFPTQTSGDYLWRGPTERTYGEDLLLSSSDLAVVTIDMQPIFYFVKHDEFEQSDRSGEVALQDLAQIQRRVINAVIAYRSRHQKTEHVSDSDLYRGVFFTEWIIPEKKSDYDGNVWWLEFNKPEYFIQSRDVMRQRVVGPGAELFNRLGCAPIKDPKLVVAAPDNISTCSANDRVDLLIRTMPELQDMLQRGAKKTDKSGAGAFGPGSELPPLLHEFFVDEAKRRKVEVAGHCRISTSNASCADESNNGIESPVSKFKTLIVMGIETDFCVLATVLGAMDAGYHCIVVEDAVASSKPDGHKAQLKHTFHSYGSMIKVAHSEELIQALLA